METYNQISRIFSAKARVRMSTNARQLICSRFFRWSSMHKGIHHGAIECILNLRPEGNVNFVSFAIYKTLRLRSEHGCK